MPGKPPQGTKGIGELGSDAIKRFFERLATAMRIPWRCAGCGERFEKIDDAVHQTRACGKLEYYCRTCCSESG